MENSKIESRYLHLFYEFRAFIRCMKAGFYRPNYQKVFCVRLSKDLAEDFLQNIEPSI